MGPSCMKNVTNKIPDLDKGLLTIYYVLTDGLT